MESVKKNAIEFLYKPSNNAVCNGLELHSLDWISSRLRYTTSILLRVCCSAIFQKLLERTYGKNSKNFVFRTAKARINTGVLADKTDTISKNFKPSSLHSLRSTFRTINIQFLAQVNMPSRRARFDLIDPSSYLLTVRKRRKF